MNYKPLELEDMAWSQLKYTRREVNEAGGFLQTPGHEPGQKLIDMILQAIDVLDNFRVAHAFPLNTLQIRLRNHAKYIDENSIIAQRLKRLSSIMFKLNRFKTMKLWDIQDIGGCRAIMHNLNHVEQLVDSYKSGSIRHRLVHEDNYIKQPRDSGYRSRHLVYRYFSDRNDTYNNLKIEIQIRTAIQHAWATAVETVDAFTKQALKASSGQRDWERFFQLMGTRMAHLEGTPPVPGTPIGEEELLSELRHCANELRVKETLTGFTAALHITRPIKGDYYLFSLDTVAQKLEITEYTRKKLEQASKDYAKKEREIRGKEGADAVLVSVDSIHNLRRAYPNYFADTAMFLKILKDSIKKDSIKKKRG